MLKRWHVCHLQGGILIICPILAYHEPEETQASVLDIPTLKVFLKIYFRFLFFSTHKTELDYNIFLLWTKSLFYIL